MKSKLINVFLFTAGAAIGSAVTWKFLKTKYEYIAQAEIDSVKEAFAKLNVAKDTDEDSEECNTEDEDNGPPEELDGEDPQDHMLRLYEYEAKLQRLKYASVGDRQEGGGEPVILAPYVISPDDFGEGDYETSMLTYYVDGVLEDDYWNVIKNPEDIVGSEFMNHFDEYVEDTVFIRNEELHTDYEITRDKRTLAESQAESPYGVNANA